MSAHLSPRLFSTAAHTSAVTAVISPQPRTEALLFQKLIEPLLHCTLCIMKNGLFDLGIVVILGLVPIQIDHAVVTFLRAVQQHGIDLEQLPRKLFGSGAEIRE